jgi:hypothetical protein
MEETRSSRLRCAPLVVARELSGLARSANALGVRMTPALGVSFRRDEHVLAHGMKVLAAERAAVRRRFAALRTP